MRPVIHLPWSTNHSMSFSEKYSIKPPLVNYIQELGGDGAGASMVLLANRAEGAAGGHVELVPGDVGETADGGRGGAVEGPPRSLADVVDRRRGEQL